MRKDTYLCSKQREYTINIQKANSLLGIIRRLKVLNISQIIFRRILMTLLRVVNCSINSSFDRLGCASVAQMFILYLKAHRKT